MVSRNSPPGIPPSGFGVRRCLWGRAGKYTKANDLCFGPELSMLSRMAVR